MIIRKLRPSQGIKFAWLPVHTPEGMVWLEWVHFRWEPSWGWGSSGSYHYRRWVAETLYNEGVRAYATPPDPKIFCKNYRADGPTPCHYPNCLWPGAVGEPLRCLQQGDNEA